MTLCALSTRRYEARNISFAYPFSLVVHSVREGETDETEVETVDV